MSFTSIMIGDESLLIGCGNAVLDRGHKIAAVVTRNSDVLAWAQSHDLPLVDAFDGLTDRFGPGEIDWLLSIANLRLLPPQVLALAGKGAVNFHDGPLPDYAGLNTPAWALFNGEGDYGITWHMVEDGVDEGDILVQHRFDISPDETAFSLNSKCYAAAMDSFLGLLDQLESGLARKPQDLSGRRYFGAFKRPEGAGFLDFAQPADSLARHIRALDFGGYWNPLTTAKIRLDGKTVVVGQASVDPDHSGAPGEVIATDDNSLTVATASGALIISGLRHQDGAPLDLPGELSVGEKLTMPTAADLTAADKALASCVRAESHWRQHLRDMQSLAPSFEAGPETEMTPRNITVSPGTSEAQVAAAIAIWALKSCGRAAGDIAINIATAGDGLDLISGWAPAHIDASDCIAELVARMDGQITKLRETGGFARDLLLRDPALAAIRHPDIALSLDGADPLPGAAIRLRLTGAALTLDADPARVSDTMLALLEARLHHLLDALSSWPQDRAVRDIDIMPDAERDMLLTRWNDTARDHDRSETIHGAFEAQVARTPEAAALVCEDQRLSYAELNQRANTLAIKLRELGAAPGVHVGLCMRRSTDLVAAALAILKTGAAYVPMDPAYPARRLAHYVADSRASIVMTDSASAADLPDSKAHVLCTDGLATDPGAANPETSAGPDDLAYLIYTSGSTGQPKGVMVEHRNVMNFFAGMDDRVPHRTGDTWLAVTSLNFDISVLEIFWTLARGFKLVLSADENRAAVSNGPIAVSSRRMDFNLMYWGNDDGPGPKKYELLLEGAKFADANGFNAVWTPERHFHAFGGPYPNPAVTGAAVAAVTQNLAVRAGSCVAPLHHPARIAEEWAVIDNLTAGRTGIGFASGWQPDDFILRPENTPPQNKPAMFDTLDTVRRLWRGEEVAFDKADGTQHAVITQPRPVSDELAVWVTTAGNPETWKEAGAAGANVLTHLLGQSIDEVADKIQLYRTALRQAGHDPEAFKVTLMLHSYLADTREAAAEVAREPMREYLRAAAGLIKQYAWAFPAFKRPKGVSNPFEMDLGTLSEDELDAILDFAFERYFEDSGLFGTIGDGLARVEQLKRIGVDEIACLIDYGIAPDLVMEGLKPLAEVLRRANAPVELPADDFSLAAQLIRHKVTHLQCTPSMARIIAMNDEASAAISGLSHLLLGGEAVPADLVAELRRHSGAAIHNMYGPTETTIWSTCDTMTSGAISIGTPIANTSVYVLDQSGQPCPVGAEGELWIGGEGVARGYWQQDMLTAERFRPDPFAAGSGRIYATGDLVRWRTDGRLDYLGRSDQQIKIRGQRIEPGEIEAALSAAPGVTGAAVIALTGEQGDARLVGYVTGGTTLDTVAIQADLARQLPEAMVPSAIMQLDAFPLTPNKKIDRAALPAPGAQPRSAVPTEPLADGVEARIATIWSQILGVDQIGADDNFFQLGGHSLLAVQAHRELRATLDVPSLSITDIFRFPKLRDLAGHLAPNDAEDGPSVDAQERSQTMSRRRQMRARRGVRAS